MVGGSESRDRSMASSNLDDFFAKKDKKKGKKKKYTTSNTIAQTIEASQSAPSQETKKDIKVDIPNAPTQDSEWKDDELPTQDLEGLRVQSLSAHSQTDGSVKQEHQEYEDDDGNDESGKPKLQQSPWLQKQPDSDAPPQQLQQQQPVEKSSGGAYVPPSRRQQSQGSRPGRPPDILNDQAFPSLQASIQKEQKSKQHGDFTEVKQYRAGGRAADSTYSSPQLQLTNKYEALRNN